MNDWTYPTLEVDAVSAAEPALLEEYWRVAEARGVRAEQVAAAAGVAEVEQAEVRAARHGGFAASPLPLAGTPAVRFGF